MKVACIGSATIDVFVLLHNLQSFNYDKFTNQISFPLGSKIPLEEYKIALGGNACNVSVGLSRLGIQTSLVAEIGTDEFSKKIEKDLESEKVTTMLTHNPQRNEHFNIILSYEGERTILEEKTPEGNSLGAPNSNPDLIYLTSVAGNWKETYQNAFSKNPNSMFAFNPGPRQIEEGTTEIINFLPKFDIIFLNLQEAQKIVGVDLTDVKEVLSKLKSFGTKVVIITDGRNGSYCADSEKQFFKISSASGEKPIERTGAGDAYATGFLYGYINKEDVKECMRYAAINADGVIKKIGAQDGLLTLGMLNQAKGQFSNLEAKLL